MEKLLVCVLCTAAHVPSLILRYLPFSYIIERKRRNLLFLIYGIALSANVLLCGWLLEHQQLTITFYKMNLLLFCMVMAAVNIVVIPGYLQEHLFTFGLVAILVLMMTSGSAFIVDTVGYDTVEHGLLFSNGCFIGLFAVLYIFLRRLMTQTVTPFLNLEGKDYWNTIWFIPIAMFLASLLAVPVSAYITSMQQLVSKLMIGIATIFICRSMAQDYERMAENKFLNSQMEEQRQYYRAISDRMKAEQEARHNYKHHMAAMKNFLDTDNTEALREYINHFVEEHPTDKLIPHSGNAAVDGILMHYARMADAEGIKMEVQCHMPEKGIQDTDLCNLLGNALDNAVTAAKQKGEHPWIKVVSEVDGDMLLITVTNSFDGLVETKSSQIFSRKRVMQEGIGIHTMKKLCEKYQGICSFSWEGYEFHASFMLICGGGSQGI